MDIPTFQKFLDENSTLLEKDVVVAIRQSIVDQKMSAPVMNYIVGEIERARSVLETARHLRARQDEEYRKAIQKVDDVEHELTRHYKVALGEGEVTDRSVENQHMEDLLSDL